MTNNSIRLEDYIRSIPDWPKEGILFRDITPLLADTEALKAAILAIAAPFENEKIDYVVGIEARGFIFGSAIAEKLNAGFVPVRKKGKLPFTTESVTYELEYGTDTVVLQVTRRANIWSRRDGMISVARFQTPQNRRIDVTFYDGAEVVRDNDDVILSSAPS